MNERLKEVRAELKLSTRDLASRLGMSAGAISLLETGKRNMTSQFITSLCREFDVNEIWLRTGEGDMFAPRDKTDELSDLAVKLANEDRPMTEKLVRVVSRMSEEQIAHIFELAKLLNEEDHH